MFSATFSDDIRRLSGTILHDPGDVEVAPRNTTVEAIRQLVYPVDRDRKEALLAHLIRKDDLRQLLVFTRTKLAASRLATRLDREGLNAVAIHSDRSQPERTRALEGFKTGEIRVLVATDVAARGLDIEDLPHVVNFELPWNPQDYVHRIGRTGRAGATGEAISLVCIDEADLLRGRPAPAQAGDPVDGRGRLRARPQRRAAARSGCAAGARGSAGDPPCAPQARPARPAPVPGRAEALVARRPQPSFAALAQVAGARRACDAPARRRRRRSASRRPGRRSRASGRPRRARRRSG